MTQEVELTKEFIAGLDWTKPENDQFAQQALTGALVQQGFELPADLIGRFDQIKERTSLATFLGSGLLFMLQRRFSGDITQALEFVRSSAVIPELPQPVLPPTPSASLAPVQPTLEPSILVPTTPEPPKIEPARTTQITTVLLSPEFRQDLQTQVQYIMAKELGLVPGEDTRSTLRRCLPSWLKQREYFGDLNTLLDQIIGGNVSTEPVGNAKLNSGKKNGHLSIKQLARQANVETYQILAICRDLGMQQARRGKHSGAKKLQSSFSEVEAQIILARLRP